MGCTWSFQKEHYSVRQHVATNRASKTLSWHGPSCLRSLKITKGFLKIAAHIKTSKGFWLTLLGLVLTYGLITVSNKMGYFDWSTGCRGMWLTSVPDERGPVPERKTLNRKKQDKTNHNTKMFYHSCQSYSTNGPCSLTLTAFFASIAEISRHTEKQNYLGEVHKNGDKVHEKTEKK